MASNSLRSNMFN